MVIRGGKSRTGEGWMPDVMEICLPADGELMELMGGDAWMTEKTKVGLELLQLLQMLVKTRRC